MGTERLRELRGHVERAFGERTYEMAKAHHESALALIDAELAKPLEVCVWTKRDGVFWTCRPDELERFAPPLNSAPTAASAWKCKHD